MKECTKISPEGVESRIEVAYIRGSQINFVILPDALQKAPFFNRIKLWRKFSGHAVYGANTAMIEALGGRGGGRGGRGGRGGPPMGGRGFGGRDSGRGGPPAGMPPAGNPYGAPGGYNAAPQGYPSGPGGYGPPQGMYGAPAPGRGFGPPPPYR
eukprot:gene23952-27105_t